jgi:preprotein translocase subunit SecE
MSENENIENVDVELEEELAEAPEVPAKADKADKSKKAKSDGKKSKPGFFARLSPWWREMKSELKKVQWPSKKQTINNTWVVILCVIFVGVFIWIFDWLANGIIDALLSLFKG